MKALSIKQPWANAILSGRKTLEIRTWSTAYRGPLLICASLRPHQHPEYIAPDALTANMLRQLPKTPIGAAIGVCNLVDCRPMTEADEPQAMCQHNPPHGRQLYAFVLADVRRIEPYPIRGALGLFDAKVQDRPPQFWEMCKEVTKAMKVRLEKQAALCVECGKRERKIGELCFDCAGK